MLLLHLLVHRNWKEEEYLRVLVLLALDGCGLVGGQQSPDAGEPATWGDVKLSTPTVHNLEVQDLPSVTASKPSYIVYNTELFFFSFLVKWGKLSFSLATQDARLLKKC